MQTVLTTLGKFGSCTDVSLRRETLAVGLQGPQPGSLPVGSLAWNISQLTLYQLVISCHGELGAHHEGTIEIGEARDLKQSRNSPDSKLFLVRGQGFLHRNKKNTNISTPRRNLSCKVLTLKRTQFSIPRLYSEFRISTAWPK